MAITFSIDNDRIAANIQDVVLDESPGTQTPITTDTGNDIDVILTSNQLDGLDNAFETFLAGLGLSAGQKAYSVLVDGASSSNSFIQVTANGGETMNDIKLIANSSTATDWVTLAGEPLYLHVDGTGNYATLTTLSGSGGRIVAAFALTNEVINNTTHVATAGVQYVTFEPISDPDATNPDDNLALGDVLKVAVDTAVSFNFAQLDAGNFLWAAVGSASSAMLITGQDLNVKDTGSAAQIGNIEKGGTDPSDAVNTSKATDTTIGINAQHFAPTNVGDGATGVLTFVTGFKPIGLATPVYTGQNVKQIDYDGYMNISSCGIFISQLTGSGSAKMLITLWEAGGGGSDKAPADLLPEEGYSTDNNNKFSYIGNQDTDSNLRDDTSCNVASVTVRGFTWNYNDASNGTTQGGITILISGNAITATGIQANDMIAFTALDSPMSNVDGTFNRIDIKALFGSAAFDIGHIDLTQGGQESAGLGSHLIVDDDGPTITGQPMGSLTPNDLELGNVIGAMDSSAYLLAAGTDGLKSFIIKGPADSSGDFTWAYSDVDGTNGAEFNEIKGSYKGNDLYTLELNDDGTYTFKMIGELPGSTLNLNVKEIKAGAPDTNSIEVGAIENDEFVRISGGSTVGAGNINESHAFVGVDNGNLDANESLVFTLHEANGTQINFTGMSIGTKSAAASMYHVKAFLVGGGTYEADLTVPKNGVLLIDPPGAVLVSSIEVTKLTGSATKIGLGDIDIFTLPADVQLGFTVELKDGDNDAVTATFTVDIDGNNDGNYDATVNSLLAPIGSASLSFKDPGFVNDSTMGPSAMVTYDTHHQDYLIA